MRCFDRLTAGFSKKLHNLAAATAVYVGYYNFCWRLRHKGTSGKLRPTPAVAAGLADDAWTFEQFYDAVCQHEKDRRAAEKSDRSGSA